MSPAHAVLDKWAIATAREANEIRRKIEDLPTHCSPAPWRYEAAKALRDAVAKIREEVLAAEAGTVLAISGRVGR